LIAAEKTNYPVAVMCRVLGVSRTGFHNWERRAPSDRALSDTWLAEKIKQLHDQSRGVYGAPRIHAELRMEHGIRVGRKWVWRLMKAAGISGVRPKKRWKTTIRIPGITPAADLVHRDFTPAAPNVLWVADITYLRTGEGWLYLAAVQDAFSRQTTREIDQRAKADERVKLLCQIRGIGPYIAMLIIAEIGEVKRFPTAKHLCQWAGLTPTVRSSDGKARLGHISRQGSTILRWALTEAAQHTPTGGGPLRAKYDRIAKRRGSKIARVAIAREILSLCYYGLRDGEIRCLSGHASDNLDHELAGAA
jgi:hypothetical protein